MFALSLIPPFAPFRCRLAALTAVLLAAALVPLVVAADPVAGASPDTPAQSAMMTLINRLVERGVLTKKDSADLLLLAEADAAEARAQAAMTQAALARAAAVEARARAMLALAGMQSAAAPAADVSALAHAAAAAEETDRAVAAAKVKLERRPVSAASAETESGDEAPPAAIHRARAAPAAPTGQVAVAEPESNPAAAPGSVHPAPNGTAEDPAGDGAVPEDTVRVTYVPEAVKAQLREEVKQDVLDEARKEGWATPQAVPGWVTRFRLFGDLRFRYEGDYYPAGNDNTGAFPNFNAINTGAPFDTSGNVFSPQLNVDQNRSRLRLRARLGTEVDLGDNFAVGLRAATGENDSPVTQNQSLGAANSAQGGNFAKYALWLDRAFLRYELGGLPDDDLTVTVGRFDNPFFCTSMEWADDLGFDGAAFRGRFSAGEDVTPFFSVGAFPVFNTELNFATTSPAKFKSNDKWLYAAQLGSTFELGRNISWKIGAAYYLFHNVEGKLSDPYTPLIASDAGNTDDSRPAFAQTGNTYMALRDIVPSPLNNNGTINQFQYYGLASKFHELGVTTKLDFNYFEPFQISLTGDYVRNLGFDRQAVAAVAVNNRGAPAAGSTTGLYQGGNTAWLVRLTVGAAALQKRGDWNVNLGYRKVESDAVVDGFCDSDFGLGGTNWRGFTLGGNVALSPSVWLGARWMSAESIAGPAFKNDILQVDLNGKF